MSILPEFTPFDINSDGVNEINHLKPLPFEVQSNNVPSTNNLVVVFVEDRLLVDLGSGAPSTNALINRLKRLKVDLRAGGYSSWFLEASVYSGSQHRDGRTLLALREFLRKVRQANRSLVGALLIGSFPEAMIVRRWLWRRDDINLTVGNHEYKNISFLRIVPEQVAARADIVLADLDGRWKEIYHQASTPIESIEAIPDEGVSSTWPKGTVTFESSRYNRSNISFRDFFWINDSSYTVLSETANKLRLRTREAMRHPELVASQKTAPNPLAIPNLFISRINARSIATSPNRNFTDRNGRGFLDPNGKPQTVHAEAIPNLSWTRDPVLERRLIIDYLDRNHSFRIGIQNNKARSTGAIAYPKKDFTASSLNNYLKKASNTFTASIVTENANLIDYVKWLKEPAVLKGIVAHSSAWNTSFSVDYNPRKLVRAAGGKPWRWQRQGDTLLYRPSFADQGSAADLYLHRTLWENNILRNSGASILMHQGCHVLTPQGASTNPYNYQTYGNFQNGEGILFYLNFLAILGRSKVFYDRPLGFPEALGAKNRNAHVGGGWKAYFEIDSEDSNLLTNRPSSCKRTYFWSILGDWTLHLFYSKEDCVPLNPSRIRVVKSGNLWRVMDDVNISKALKTRAQAEKVFRVMKHYGFTQQCFVGRPNASMEYYLVDGQAPVGAMPGEDAMQINPMRCKVERKSNRWMIMEGSIRWLSFPTWEEAEHALSMIRRYEFTRICFVDRPQPIMTYFRR